MITTYGVVSSLLVLLAVLGLFAFIGIQFFKKDIT